MEIKKIYPENLKECKAAVYALTVGDSISVKDVEPCSKFHMKAYCLYNETGNDGIDREVLSIATNEGVLSAISVTFKTEFFKIVEVMGDQPFEFEVKKGKSKKGRDFVSCQLVYDIGF